MSRQNVYDDQRFFAAYQEMRKARAGINESLEQPATLALLPDVTGLDALDIGCGEGTLCRQLIAHGAKKVIGVDPSARMLELARAQSNDSRISYIEAFAEQLQLPDASVDLVVSCLALHYLSTGSLLSLARDIARWLRPGGWLVTSMEHPIMTASPHLNSGPQFILDGYADEGPRSTTWFVDGVVKHHRTLATTLNAFIDAGLVIEQVLEPAPSVALSKRRPELAIHRRRPPLLVIRCRRRDPTDTPTSSPATEN